MTLQLQYKSCTSAWVFLFGFLIIIVGIYSSLQLLCLPYSFPLLYTPVARRK